MSLQLPRFTQLLSRSLANQLALIQACIRGNAHRASLAPIRRRHFPRLYPNVLALQPDGSTIRLRYHEPRRILHLPVDISTCSPDVRAKKLASRQPKVPIRRVEEFEDTFNVEELLEEADLMGSDSSGSRKFR